MICQLCVRRFCRCHAPLSKIFLFVVIATQLYCFRARVIVSLVCLLSSRPILWAVRRCVAPPTDKISDKMTSFDAAWRHYQQKWYHLVEQAQGYVINVYLFPSALTERNPRGVSILTALYHGGVLVSSYVRGLVYLEFLISAGTCFCGSSTIRKIRKY